MGSSNVEVNLGRVLRELHDSRNVAHGIDPAATAKTLTSIVLDSGNEPFFELMNGMLFNEDSGILKYISDTMNLKVWAAALLLATLFSVSRPNVRTLAPRSHPGRWVV